MSCSDVLYGLKAYEEDWSEKEAIVVAKDSDERS